MANREIRDIAESLVGSFSHHSQPQCSQHTLNLISDDWLVGHQMDGRMSTVRRFFCLFVTFDFLLTTLLWLICVVIRGDSLKTILTSEVLNYNIKSSHFDIVVIALIRFLLLVLFYGCIRINNWSVIALTTGGTCSFMLAKVFVYDWPNAKEPVYEVLLIVATFVVAWGEAWFMDFRVLPQESQAKRIISTFGTQQHQPETERTPLLRHGPGSHLESVSNFFSPVGTPENSPRPKSNVVILTQEHIEEYKSNATQSVQKAWRVINQPGWKTEKRQVNGDVVESLNCQEYGKVFRFTGVVECPAQFLFGEVSSDLTKLPDWNPTILEAHYIKSMWRHTFHLVLSDHEELLLHNGLILPATRYKKIDEQVDLSYQVTAGGGKGIIAPRDFVTLRRFCGLNASGEIIPANSDEEAAAYISAGTSVECPGYPPKVDIVRGENKVGCWCIRPLAPHSSGGHIHPKCTFQWMLSCDLKGRIPQFVIDTAFSTVMFDYVGYVRKHIKNCKEKNMF